MGDDLDHGGDGPASAAEPEAGGGVARCTDMRVLALVSLAAAGACSSRPAPRPPTVPPTSGARTAPRVGPVTSAPVSSAQLLASLDLRGASWEQALARIPAAQARRVAVDFLRSGELGCRKVVTEEVGCGEIEESFAPVAPDATLEDPCLRRHVARWALAQLEATDASVVADELAAIVALPHPERALADEVIALLPPGDDALRLRLIEAATAAAREDVADALLPGLTPFGAARALVELGREGALAHLGDAPVPSTLAAALEGGVSQPTALAIVERLTPADLQTPAVAAAVRAAATGDDCQLAAAAAALFDEAGDPQYLPSHAGLTTEAAATRALCVAAHVSTDEALGVLRTLVARDGLDLVAIDRDGWATGDDGRDPDLDGDGDPATSATRTHVAPGALDADTLVDWLPTACSGGTCATDGGTVTLGFTRTSGGGLALEEIAVERAHEGCGC